MNQNEKPQAISPGRSLNTIDHESIKDNFTHIVRQDAQSNLIKSLLLVANGADKAKNNKDYLDGLKRRDDAALRLPPLRCGCRDPQMCRCNKGGKR
jgi:hypothetical protein